MIELAYGTDEAAAAAAAGEVMLEDRERLRWSQEGERMRSSRPATILRRRARAAQLRVKCQARAGRHRASFIASLRSSHGRPRVIEETRG